MAPKFKGEKIRFHTPPQPKNLLDREPHEIPGTLAWLENKPYYVSPEPTSSSPGPCLEAAKIRNNRYMIEKIKQYIQLHGWQMIEGGEEHGQWINTGKYPNILFEPGQVNEIETGRPVLFPLSDGVEDPLGIAFRFQQCANGQYTVVTNEWYTIEATTRRGRRAALRELKKKRKQARGLRPHEHRVLYNSPRKPTSSLTRPTTSPPTTAPRISLEITE